MDFQDIKVERAEGLGFLTINRTDRNNAVRAQTLQEICAGLDDLSADAAVKAIVLRAEGKHFCAGADFVFLEGLTRMTPSQVQREIYSHFQGAARRVYGCPKPTVALVSGAAVTVGCELALACDFRLVSDTAKFQESWVKLGLMPPLGGLFLLPRLVGLSRASQMVLLGQALTAEEAVKTGLASELVSVDQLDIRGREFAAELAKLPPLAYAAIKQGLHRGMESSMEHEWAANVLAQSVLLSTEDYREGLAAVKERRAADFQGR